MMLEFSATLENDTSEIRQHMKEEITRLIYDVADAIHAEATLNIVHKSHDTGTLLDSLNVDYGNGWAKIGANTPYAKADHDGFPGHIQIVPLSVVREHTRKRGGKSYNVRQHVRGEHARWMPERTGKKWLDDAIKKVLSQLEPEIRDMIVIERVDGEFNG